MAHRITIQEWPAQLEAVETAIKARWSWLITSINPDRLELHVETANRGPSGSVCLDVLRGGQGVMKVRCQMTGGGGIMGTLSEAENAMLNCRDVLDALHCAQAMTTRLEIYAFNGIPCETCGGSGEVREQLNRTAQGKKPVSKMTVCPVCKGTGKKPVAEEANEGV